MSFVKGPEWWKTTNEPLMNVVKQVFKNFRDGGDRRRILFHILFGRQVRIVQAGFRRM